MATDQKVDMVAVGAQAVVEIAVPFTNSQDYLFQVVGYRVCQQLVPVLGSPDIVVSALVAGAGTDLNISH